LAAVLETDAEAKLRLRRIGRCDPGEGFFSADGDPSSVADFVRATFSHKGRRERRGFIR
jgi:hypothetical protein